MAATRIVSEDLLRRICSSLAVVGGRRGSFAPITIWPQLQTRYAIGLGFRAGHAKPAGHLDGLDRRLAALGFLHGASKGIGATAVLGDRPVIARAREYVRSLFSPE